MKELSQCTDSITQQKERAHKTHIVSTWVDIEQVYSVKSLSLCVDPNTPLKGASKRLFTGSKLQKKASSGRLYGPPTREKRLYKAFKVKQDMESLNIGRNIMIKKVESLGSRAVIGRMDYVRLNKHEMIDLVIKTRKPIFITYARFYGF